jgi:hypothetical protein
MEGNRISKKVLCMNLETTRLRGRPRNRWQDEVREDGRLVHGKGWKEGVYNRGIEETPENDKESPHSAHANGMNIVIVVTLQTQYINSITVSNYLNLLS